MDIMITLNLKISIKIFLAIFLSVSKYTVAQADFKNNGAVSGKFTEDIIDGDSIFFTNGGLNNNYYQFSRIGSKIDDKNFEFKTSLDYPHLLFVNLKSERNNVAQRGGFYFIDKSTTNIRIDSIGECSFVNGKTQREFEENFIPFLFSSTKYECSQNQFSKLFYFEKEKFDSLLLKYIEKNQNSFVGLWFLIMRIEKQGFSNFYQIALSSFSPMIKQTHLWKTANKGLNEIRIKEDQAFPQLKLKNQDLNSVKLKFSNSKYTLVDFWFSSCRPCIEAFPFLKKIYDKYNSKGFEIISISIDRTENIKKWKDLIIQKDLRWPQYLDENGKEAKKEKIIRFPTTFLLNEEGHVIKKNISHQELEFLLETTLESND